MLSQCFLESEIRHSRCNLHLGKAINHVLFALGVANVTNYSLTLVLCLSYWLSPSITIPMDCLLSVSAAPPAIRKSSGAIDPFYEMARSITVRVKVGHNGGSGILIQRSGQQYTVLTNRHVVNVGSTYVIQTPDGRSHPATLLKKIDFRGNDLAMLQFRASQSYEIATLGSTKHLAPGDFVISAGFPLDDAPVRSKGLLITVGKVSLLPKKPFVGGYQIGYTNLIRQGMSGGPLLNLQGQVVGINSLHAHPLWGDPYIFQDGTKPAKHQRQTIVQSSWAVPIDTFKVAAKQ